MTGGFSTGGTAAMQCKDQYSVVEDLLKTVSKGLDSPANSLSPGVGEPTLFSLSIFETT